LDLFTDGTLLCQVNILIIVSFFSVWPAEYDDKQENMVSQIVCWNFWWQVPWLSDRLLVILWMWIIRIIYGMLSMAVYPYLIFIS